MIIVHSIPRSKVCPYTRKKTIQYHKTLLEMKRKDHEEYIVAGRIEIILTPSICF